MCRNVSRAAELIKYLCLSYPLPLLWGAQTLVTPTVGCMTACASCASLVNPKETVPTMHRRENQILPSLKYIRPRMGNNMNSPVERVPFPLVTPLLWGAQISVTPYCGVHVLCQAPPTIGCMCIVSHPHLRVHRIQSPPPVECMCFVLTPIMGCTDFSQPPTIGCKSRCPSRCCELL